MAHSPEQYIDHNAAPEVRGHVACGFTVCISVPRKGLRRRYKFPTEGDWYCDRCAQLKCNAMTFADKHRDRMRAEIEQRLQELAVEERERGERELQRINDKCDKYAHKYAAWRAQRMEHWKQAARELGMAEDQVEGLSLVNLQSVSQIVRALHRRRRTK